MTYYRSVFAVLIASTFLLNGCSSVPMDQRDKLITSISNQGLHYTLPNVAPKTFFITTIVRSDPGDYVGDDLVKQGLAAALIAKGYKETTKEQAN